MPEMTVPSDGTVKELVDPVQASNGESFHVRVKDDNVRITQTDDERYADQGNIYPQGASTWLSVRPGNALYAVNAGSVDATVEVDQSPAPAAVTQDPAASGTTTVTDDGSFNLAGNQDVDIAEQSLASLDVSAATVTVTDDGSFVLDAASQGTLPTEQQTPVQLEDSGGTNVDPAQQGALDAEYSSIDLNATGTTTIYDGATECYIGGVYLNNSGSTAEVQLEVTDGTSTAVLQGADDSAGVSIEFDGLVPLNSDDDLQMNVTTAEGSSLSETAVVFREEL